MGNVRLSYTGTPQVVVDANFSSSTEGFTAKGLSGATYSAQIQYGELVVTAKEEYGGVRRNLATNATVGDVYEIRLIVDQGTTDVVRLFMSEGGDPNTPEWQEYLIQNLEPGIQEIDFTYVVTETGNLSLNLDKTPDSSLLNVETNFKILEAEIEKVNFEILEENSYYAFGMKHEGYNVVNATDPALKYKYNGKELQDEMGLGWYDYQARNYDPALGRWFNVDPLAETSRRYSPYTYALDNPIYFIDPDGMEAESSSVDMEVEYDMGYGRKATATSSISKVGGTGVLKNDDKDDIILRAKNASTGNMEDIYIIKSDLIDVTIESEDIVVTSGHDPISNRQNPFTPIVDYSKQVDQIVQCLTALFGTPDAYIVNFAGELVGGGGMSASTTVAIINRGKDAGGIFLYTPTAPVAGVGLSVGIGFEVGVLYSTGSSSNFSRNSVEGLSVNIGGGYGPVNASGSMGIKSLINWTLTSFTFTSGTGTSLRSGGSASISETKLQTTLRKPD
ncbi:hypothetical protein GCM10007424_07730 [Flavobacterium suaedae]|uniref:RHS repeat-associated core domain-containing protein n=1 Tax=Flavobacterium suaedae TaxID=1767027 RepID=A0ABQ1JJT4_9FLAO|nr:RHS repeat-associated core domain-containing protein [Flavobacterium suaedae]GGB70245.1 hypothetical protein GCM10007424_07730 [Flavobacterium suaedae]